MRVHACVFSGFFDLDGVHAVVERGREYDSFSQFSTPFEGVLEARSRS